MCPGREKVEEEEDEDGRRVTKTEVEEEEDGEVEEEASVAQQCMQSHGLHVPPFPNGNYSE